MSAQARLRQRMGEPDRCVPDDRVVAPVGVVLGDQPPGPGGKASPPPELSAGGVPGGGRHAGAQAPPLVRHQDVLIPAGPDTKPAPKKKQPPSMDKTGEKRAPASPVSLPQRAA